MKDIKGSAWKWFSAMLLAAYAVAPVWAADPPAVQHVKEVRGTPMVYEKDGEQFRRVGPLPAEVDLRGARILENSPKGYVRVDIQPAPVWVDKLKVRLDVAAPKTRCGSIVTSSSESVTAGVRGAGEGCK